MQEARCCPFCGQELNILESANEVFEDFPWHDNIQYCFNCAKGFIVYITSTELIIIHEIKKTKFENQ